MRGKSPPSEHDLEKIKPHNSLRFSRDFVKGDFIVLVMTLYYRINSRIF